MKKFITLLLAIFVFVMPVCAKESVKMNAHMDSPFSEKYYPKEIKYKTKKKMKLFNEIDIPQRSVLTAEVYTAQRELRWHKSGFFICKLISYQPELADTPTDISDKEIYLIGRKYEKIDKKEAAITGTEIVLAQAASFFAPGVDIAYFFTKGAIQRKKNPHWFKAGVSNAYDNSICWFWLKGKPIKLKQGDEIQLKSIKKEKIEKIQIREAKRTERFERQEKNREYKRTAKALRKRNFDKVPQSVIFDEIGDYVLTVNPDDLTIEEQNF